MERYREEGFPVTIVRPSHTYCGGKAVVEMCIRDRSDIPAVDASGCVVTPGFVDIHRHCDAAPLRDADFGRVELAQGIT